MARLCWFFWFGLLVSGATWAQPRVITWATNPQYPPYDWASAAGEYQGAAVELLALLAPKDVTFKAVMVPWKRAQEMAKQGEIDLLVNIRMTPERALWLDFSSNPTFFNPIAIFMREDSVIPFKSWDELKPLAGGTALGDTYGNGFDEYLAKNLKTFAAKSMVENFLMLDNGRIDWFVSGYYMGMAWLSGAKFQHKIVALKPMISTDSIHLGFSKRSPHREVLAEIDQKLSRLGKDGTLQRILDKYIESFGAAPSDAFPQ